MLTWRPGHLAGPTLQVGVKTYVRVSGQVLCPPQVGPGPVLSHVRAESRWALPEDTLAQWLSDPAPPGSMLTGHAHLSPLLGAGSPVLPARPEQTSAGVLGPAAKMDSQGDRLQHVPLDFTVAGGHIFFQPRERPVPEEGPAGHVAPTAAPASLCTSCHQMTRLGGSIQLGPGGSGIPCTQPASCEGSSVPAPGPVSPSAPRMGP